MCSGSDSARKTWKHGEAPKAKSTSREVEDELASMRGTKDTDRINYLERKQIRGVSNVMEEPRIASNSAASLGKEDDTEVSSSRLLHDSSPAKSQHMSKRHGAKSAAGKDKGILCHLFAHTQSD